MKISFSAHALLRYIERVYGIDIESVRPDGMCDKEFRRWIFKNMKLSSRIYEEICPDTDSNRIALSLSGTSGKTYITSEMGDTIAMTGAWDGDCFVVTTLYFEPKKQNTKRTDSKPRRFQQIRGTYK